MVKNNLKYNVLQVAGMGLFVLGLLAVYIIYLQTWDAEALNNKSANQRNAALEQDILRGSILDSKGRILAQSESLSVRSYPYGEAAAPVTGYLGERIGHSGIEASANRELLGLTTELNGMGPVRQLSVGDRGNDVKLTIDAELQQTAFNALGNNKGAVVVLDADTGEVLVMASNPTFDPNYITDDWTELNKDKGSPLLNRAVQGMYPPGSTIKPMIAAAAVNNGLGGERFNCTGKLVLEDGTSIRESHGAVHGRVNLEEALTVSCNVAFGTLAMELGGNRLQDTFRSFGFDRDLDTEIKLAEPLLPDFPKLGPGDTAQMGIGQGSLLVTPMHMALLAASFANHGEVMQPYLIKEIISPQGVVLHSTMSSRWFRSCDAAVADLIDTYMLNVVQEGTGGGAAVRGVRVTGKTGTAENAAGEDHAWFIGTADAGRRIAFAIIVENGGGGGTVAAPIARQIIQKMVD